MQSTNKKICLVSVSLAKGGAERSCAMLSQMLSKEGYEVWIVVLNDEIDYEYQGSIFNMGKTKGDTDTFGKRLTRFRKLRKFLKSNKFDYIIDHRPKNYLLREFFYTKVLYRGFKLINVYHTSRKEAGVTAYPKLFKLIAKNIYAHVAVSEYINREILGMLNFSNRHTIQNPVYTEWPSGDTENFSDKSCEKYILAYGRIVDSVKDLSFLLRSFEYSKLYLENVCLVILGDGPDVEKLKKMALEMDATDHIEFLPFVSNPKKIIENAHFVTLTSFYEGFPMVLIEALSLGTPVVSLDIISGPGEIITNRQNGLLVKERREQDFANAMREMINNDSLYLACKNKAKLSVEQYSMGETIKKWNNILQ